MIEQQRGRLPLGIRRSIRRACGEKPGCCARLMNRSLATASVPERRIETAYRRGSSSSPSR